MLPTKGYFQDIECPFYDNSCNRPYCHFRHKKKNQEDDNIIENNDNSNEVPTYKPTPKSELANIKNHIPISYIPDLVFRSSSNNTNRSTTTRIPSTATITTTISKANLPTYKPTPLSILSSVNNQKQSNNTNSSNNTTEKNKEDNNRNNKEIEEDSDEIKTIKQNIANVEYNPEVENDINFEDLSAEFELIDNIIVDTTSKSSNENYNINNKEKSKETNKRDKHRSSSSSSNSKSRSKTSSSNSKSRSKTSSSSSSRHKSSSKSSSRSSDKDRQKNDSKSKHKSDSKSKHKSSSSNSSSSHKKHSSTSSSKHSKHHDNSKESKRSHKEKDDKKKRSEHSHKSDKISTKDHNNSKIINKNSKNKSDDDNIMELDNDELEEEIEDEEDEDTYLECYKIFQEYKPELNETKTDNNLELTKGNHEEIEDNLIKPRKRIAHNSGQEQNKNNNNNNTNVNKVKIQPNPAHVMANRFKLAKLQKEQEQKNENDLIGIKRQLNDDQIKINKIQKITNVKIVKRIAPVQNVNSIQLAKAKIVDEINKRKLLNNNENRTQAQTFKGTKRVAHVPDDQSLSDIPDVINIEKSKLPINVRTRYLTLIANECIKLYLNKNDAYKRALNEEFICYEKCKVLVTYRNSAMLTINRLRKEIQEREKSGLDLIENFDDDKNNKNKNSTLKREELYNKLKNYLLTDEELNIHGYPRESLIPGHAIILNNNNTNNLNNINLDENKRKCSRCSKIYLVDKNGIILYEEECVYHPLKKRTIRGEQKYLCCKSNDDFGCATSNTHVCELNQNALDGYQITLNSNNTNDIRNYSVYALDCEMCYTTKGLELTRVTIVDADCKTVYETLVKPLNPIIDYNTTFSGITKEQMDKTSTNILQVQANILHLCNSNTILIGHSLESDMKALKIIHTNIIDTSVLFPHKMGLPHKRALRVLASEYLKKIIQNNINGHDSAEDAITCMELVLWKLKEDMKVKGIK